MNASILHHMPCSEPECTRVHAVELSFVDGQLLWFALDSAHLECKSEGGRVFFVASCREHTDATPPTVNPGAREMREQE